MSTTIKKVNDRHYTINGKTAYLDMNEDWLCVEELTTNEKEAFRKHLAAEKETINQEVTVSDTGLQQILKTNKNGNNKTTTNPIYKIRCYRTTTSRTYPRLDIGPDTITKRVTGR